MHVLTFEIAHLGCWARDVSAAFPNATLAIRASMPVQGRAEDVVAVRASDADELAAVGRAFGAHPRVKEAIPLATSGTMGFWHVVGREESSLIDVVSRHRAFPHGPVRIRGGLETWTVGLAQRDEAKSLLDDLGHHGEVRVVSLAQDTFRDIKLTDAQARVLRVAISEGYYDFPRRTSPTKLAKQLGLAKSTLLEHLQRAEAKVILGADWLL